MKKAIIFSMFMCLFLGCKAEREPINVTPKDLHSAIDKVVGIMVNDIFSPPVASRIFVYPNIAAYEIMAQNNSNYNSLQGQITDLKSIPKVDSELVNYNLAALIAHLEVSKTLVYSKNIMQNYSDSLYTLWSSKNKKEFEASKNYAMQVADHINTWKNTDNYTETRTMPQYVVNQKNPARWQKTPPAFMDGIEPHWNKLRPFVIDYSAQFKPIPPPEFSMDKSSLFYKELKEVYDISNAITENGDASEEVEIAQFWDCNPYVSVTRGHLMFAVKKITPGAHWIGICKIACNESNSSFEDTIFTYTKTSIAIADAFISCWDEKYRSNLVRPETLINKHFDENWKPILQTPPFPEYTSGHSVVSGAAAIILTSIFGDNFAFDDDTEVKYGLPIRSFESFNKAADEAAISRMYGGIHYREAVEVGLRQGRNLGGFVIENLKMKVN
ncbi:vanadium-dependent haloperoxidase [Changchengzhania lutea]|uniref:vanadium-dependent haloperoxidase n=1 Tax=Changchengzhania lutea TaxID=2049305 RepID=UPI00115CE4CF|nr:vanadium-dependent haloperoxidase [Changchengzhania lutea]